MRINVVITPNAKVPAVVRLDENAYKIKVDAPATEGRANRRLVEILAGHFGVPKSHVRVLKGFKNRNKVVEIV